MLQFKDTSEAAVDAIQTILHLCEKSGMVKRIIYTGSVTAASPLKEDGTGYGGCLDESCWTPLNISFPYPGNFEAVHALIIIILIWTTHFEIEIFYITINCTQNWFNYGLVEFRVQPCMDLDIQLGLGLI